MGTKKDKKKKGEEAAVRSKADVKAELTTVKEERKAAKEELRAFEKENSLEKGTDHSGDAKLGKKWTKLNDAYQSKSKKVEALEEEVKTAKSSSTPRPSKYAYPKNEKGEEMSAQEKKKYRAKMRNEAKKKDKGDKEGGEEKKGSKKKKDKTKGKGDQAAAETGKSATKKKKKTPAAEAAEGEKSED